MIRRDNIVVAYEDDIHGTPVSEYQFKTLFVTEARRFVREDGYVIKPFVLNANSR